MITSSTFAGSACARSSTAFRATAPSWGAGTSASSPRYLPMGVRAAARRNASGMGHLFAGRRTGAAYHQLWYAAGGAGTKETPGSARYPPDPGFRRLHPGLRSDHPSGVPDKGYSPEGGLLKPRVESSEPGVR